MRFESDLAIRGSVFAAAYLLGGLLFFLIFGAGAHGSPVWPPVGILFGVLAVTPPARWPFWLGLSLVLSLSVCLFSGHPLLASIGLSIADMATALAGVLLLRWNAAREFRLDSLKDYFLLVGLGGGIAPVLGALVAAGSLSAGTDLPFAHLFALRWGAACTGVILFAPLIIMWRGDWPKKLVKGRHGAELVVLLAAAATVPVLAFGLLDRPISYLTVPILLWAAIRFGPFEAALCHLIVSAWSVYLVQSGATVAEMQALPPASEMLFFQMYLVVSGVCAALTVAFALRDYEKVNTELAVEKARWQAVMDYAPIPIAIRALDGGFLRANREFMNWFPNAGSVAGKSSADMFPPELAEISQSEALRIAGGGKAATTKHELPYQGGELHHLDITRFPICNAAGDVTAIGAISVDVTETRKAYEQLNQAQKMEAVGQLTGGIAHDFNNLLAVIIGNLELAMEILPEDGVAAGQVRTAFNASERGAALVQRLLAFSRRQALRPVLLDLNQSIGEIDGLLRRTLGEQIDIEFAPGDRLWKTEADPAHVESALLNLAINARDAMPDGGRLTLETANVRLNDAHSNGEIEDVPPGQYVMISVSDTGMGMSDEVRKQAFEPFFSTKGESKGSGLGLSMVHGFVKQSGGHVSIDSEVGHGTTVKIYLPRAIVSGEHESEELEALPTTPIAGRLKVLVVEDDDGVRKLAVDNLESLGHEAVSAADGPAALALAGQGDPPELLITDVVLSSRMSGPELANLMRELVPGLRVLFMSGYTASGVAHLGRLDPGVDLLEKPFRRADLVRAMERVLECQTEGTE